ncbi:MAG TPA: folylpolyglutamate synthase/dihydrofolate synthase family protein [Candidatus Acidoferrales bacterium]|nr:folylpolyglutamate synthase/dihydrofolate synthase family protein [Candidatus Acidoferrales bacterium]
MRYQEALRYLFALGRELASPRQARAQKFDLRNISALAERMGHLERRCPCIHIAGTNGKGSTAAMIESILRSAGLRTGLYTSPHLESINERICVGGEPISDEQFAECFERVLAAAETLMASGELAAHPTFFECLTAMAFDAFARCGAEFAVYETGMGGRLDATNIVTPEVSVITQIDFDHEAYLGHSIEEIAGEKAGIVKANGIVVCAAERPEARAVIARRCLELNARLVEVDEVWRVEEIDCDSRGEHLTAEWRADGSRLRLDVPLVGRFQIRNALTAGAAILLMRKRHIAIDAHAIERGIAGVQWPGRLERVSEQPVVYLDGAHNPAAARELRAFWDDQLAGRRIILIYGAMRDKAVDEIAGVLFPRAEHVILTQPRQSRALSVDVLSQVAGYHAAKSESIADASRAIERARQLAGSDGVVFITGSLYLVGEARAQFCSKTPTFHTAAP